MRISDWSSDVCSSDLPCRLPAFRNDRRGTQPGTTAFTASHNADCAAARFGTCQAGHGPFTARTAPIGVTVIGLCSGSDAVTMSRPRVGLRKPLSASTADALNAPRVFIHLSLSLE